MLGTQESEFILSLNKCPIFIEFHVVHEECELLCVEFHAVGLKTPLSRRLSGAIWYEKTLARVRARANAEYN